MKGAKVYVDFHNADTQGRVRLNSVGTKEDLARQEIELREGLLLTLYSDDLDENGGLDELQADGVVCFSDADRCWVATIDWSAIRHASDTGKSGAKGDGSLSRPSKAAGNLN
jgi:hypothetical protein